jgi:uncharacterized protein YxeA
MSKSTSVISSLVIMITVSMSGSIYADDFQKVLKKSNSYEIANSVSSADVNTIDTWSMNGKVRQYQYEVESKNKEHKRAMAIMENSVLNTWRENLGDPVKL